MSVKDYKKLEKLGEGTYGVVYKAKRLSDGKIVALKRVKLDPNEEGIPATTYREFSTLIELKHPFIVQCLLCVYEKGDLYIVFEFIDMDLKLWIDSQPAVPNQKLVKEFVFKILVGTEFCHSRRILHRDMKPQNILVGGDGTLKIADLGLGREHMLPITELTHEVITLWYRPPEILLGSKTYGAAVDVWGVACIWAETATKEPLFPGDSEIDELYQIFQCLGTPTEETWPGVNELKDFNGSMFPRWQGTGLAHLAKNIGADGVRLMEKMLIYDPRRRITAKDAVADKFFDDIRDDVLRKHDLLNFYKGE